MAEPGLLGAVFCKAGWVADGLCGTSDPWERTSLGSFGLEFYS